MAARSGSGIGLGVTVAVLGALSLGLFITTVIFWSQKSRAQADLVQATSSTTEFVRDTERQRDDVQAILGQAKKQNKSLVGYLTESMQTAMTRVTGQKGDTLESLGTKLGAINGADRSNLIAVVRDRDAQIGQLKKDVDAANAARATALQDRENEVKRVAGLEASQKASLAAVTVELNTYKDEVDKYREELNTAKTGMDQRVDRIQAGTVDERSRLTGQIADLQKENAIATDTIRKYRDKEKGDTVRGTDEFALVDGQIVAFDAAGNTAVVSVGRDQHVVLGMTFEVYNEASAIRPDPATREYPSGKAALEVVRVDQNTSTARIIREKRGNPIARGDVIANALFDPKKQYTFLVYGNFDADADGRATQQEQEDIKALIGGWGGKVVAELGGAVDFLVLGQRPVLPPAPRPDAPVAVIQEYVRQQRIVSEYDRLLAQATANSIPVLNENRLRTLTGGGGR